MALICVPPFRPGSSGRFNILRCDFLMFLRQKMRILQERALPFLCWWDCGAWPFNVAYISGIRAGQRAELPTSVLPEVCRLQHSCEALLFTSHTKGNRRIGEAFPVLELWNSIMLIANGLWEGSPSVWPSLIHVIPLSFSVLICEMVMMHHTEFGRGLMR